MTKDDIICMAREAGFGNYAYEAASVFERFAALVAATEREQCAKVCNSVGDAEMDVYYAADSIRARGNT